VTAAIQQIADAHPGETVAVVGHVASLTVVLARLCALEVTVWGAPLPHARPFLVEWDGRTWHCPAWPGEVEQPLGVPSTFAAPACPQPPPPHAGARRGNDLGAAEGGDVGVSVPAALTCVVAFIGSARPASGTCRRRCSRALPGRRGCPFQRSFHV